VAGNDLSRVSASKLWDARKLGGRVVSHVSIALESGYFLDFDIEEEDGEEAEVGFLNEREMSDAMSWRPKCMITLAFHACAALESITSSSSSLSISLLSSYCSSIVVGTTILASATSAVLPQSFSSLPGSGKIFRLRSSKERSSSADLTLLTCFAGTNNIIFPFSMFVDILRLLNFPDGGGSTSRSEVWWGTTRLTSKIASMVSTKRPSSNAA